MPFRALLQLIALIFALLFSRCEGSHEAHQGLRVSEKREQHHFKTSYETAKVLVLKKRVTKRRGITTALTVSPVTLSRISMTEALPVICGESVFARPCADGHERAPPVI